MGFSQKVKNMPDSSLKNISPNDTKINLNLDSKNIVHCKIKGKLVSGNSTYLMLVTEKDNPFNNGIKIPIVEGCFEYDLQTSFSEKYTLILGEELEQSAFRPITFFAENEEVNFNLHSTQEFDKNTILGGKLSVKMQAYEKKQENLFEPLEKPYSKEIDSLWDTKNYFSEEVNAVYEKIKKLEQGEELNKMYDLRDELLETEKGYTPRTWFLRKKMDSIQKLKFAWEAKYIQSNQDIVSYSLLLNEVRWYKQDKKNIDLAVMSNLVEVYSKKFPLHPYTKQINDILEGIKMVKVGGMFIDFSAPTIDGKVITASNIVSGKVALIDLWASWCGPCRVTSKSYIPIYEKYKEKGFVILGVANEFKNTNAFKKAIEKDKYPWLNLIELENKNRIWDKYNVSNSGGSTFLVDSKGVIVAIHPDAEELDKILGGLLN
jgi:thiol-disulfide isomerase/thioredoxin